MNTIKCKCCDKLADGHKMVTCCICKENYYHQCVELSASEVRNIKTKKNLNWTCTNCSNFGDNLNDLKAVILGLKKEIEELKAALPKQSSECNINFDEIIVELAERSERKNNLILFGVAENYDLQASSERQQYDKNKVADVIHFLSPDQNIENIKPIRLGKFDPTRTTSRPIKIKLENEKAVQGLIRMARNLRNSDTFSRIGISVDRTPRQIQQYRALKMELNRRISDGEADLRIKYIRGVPQIVHLN